MMALREESDLDFFSRRAMEESHAAAHALSRGASSAHRHMAVAYSVRMRDEQLAADGLAEMLALISEADDSADAIANAPFDATDGVEGGATG